MLVGKILVLTVVGEIIASANSFAVTDSSRTFDRSAYTVQKMSDVAEAAPSSSIGTVEDLTETIMDGNIVMSFLGTKNVETEPIEAPMNIEQVNEFFLKDQYRNLLFFNNKAKDVLNPTEEQMLKWLEESRLAGGHLDLKSIRPPDQILQMETYLSLPGLKVLSKTTIGAKLLLPWEHDVEYPEYEFTLLDSELHPEGSPALVWLFNQVTKYREATSSFTRVRIKNDKCDSGRNKIVFCTEAHLETRIRIPRLALKLLPVNVRRFEKQGSRAVQRLLEKELKPALYAFHDAYVSWLSTTTTQEKQAAQIVSQPSVAKK